MKTRTYDRNVAKGLALIADENYNKVRYVSILAASTLVEDTSFKMLRSLHQVAHGTVGELNPDFDASEWSRFSENLKLNQTYNVPV